MLDAIDWHDPDDTGLNFLGRSGLVQRNPRGWLDQLAELDAQAAKESAYVVGSLIPADIDNLIGLAEHAAKSGLRVLEVNVGAPHAREAAEGAIVLERNAERVRDLVFGNRSCHLNRLTGRALAARRASRLRPREALRPLSSD